LLGSRAQLGWIKPRVWTVSASSPAAWPLLAPSPAPPLASAVAHAAPHLAHGALANSTIFIHSLCYSISKNAAWNTDN